MEKDELSTSLNEKEFTKLMDELKRKVHKSISPDGLVTLEYNGAGDYLSLKFNIDLKEADSGILEEDILNLFKSSKNQLSTDLVSTLMTLSTEFENNNDDEDLGVRRDVS